MVLLLAVLLLLLLVAPCLNCLEAVKLFVVARAGGVSVEELQAYCKENFTAYKVPKQIVFRDALPMTAVGKILRRELRDNA